MDKPISESYLDHLDILRTKIIYIILFAIIAGILSFIFIDKIVAILIAPISNLKIKLHVFKPQEKFLTYIKIAFFSGLFASVPFALIQFGNFIYPAMKKKERKYFYILIIGVAILFIAGCIFSFKIIAPFVFNFFISFSANDGVLHVWGFADYYNLLILLIVMMGMVFLTPLFLLILLKIGILKLKTLQKHRKHVIIILFIIAAIITPPDVYTQAIVGVILYLLFECSILLSKLMKIE